MQKSEVRVKYGVKPGSAGSGKLYNSYTKSDQKCTPCNSVFSSPNHNTQIIILTADYIFILPDLLERAMPQVVASNNIIRFPLTLPHHSILMTL